MGLQLAARDGGFDLLASGRVILSQRAGASALTLAKGAPEVAMVRGNFRLSDTAAAAPALGGALA